MQSMLNQYVDDILSSTEVKDLENRKLKRALKKANSKLSKIGQTAEAFKLN